MPRRHILILGFSCLAVVLLFGIYEVVTEKKMTPVNSGNNFITLLQSHDISGFPQAFAPRSFSFPADHGPHPEYRIEWWYYTGNLETETGHHFGYQLTFFRVSLTPQPVNRASQWGTNQTYMAHFALTDVEAQCFYAFERTSRGALGLAGALAQPVSVWVDNWFARELDGHISPPMQSAGLTFSDEWLYLSAAEDEVGLDLLLQRGKPIVLQGDKGLSQKSAEPGNASYYYSLTRVPTRGTIRVAGKTFQVQGLSWLDHEWSTSQLGTEQVGWNWFALQLSDGSEVMFYQLRKRDGSLDPFSRGIRIHADGSTHPVPLQAIQIQILADWRSPISGTRYPARWHMGIPSERLELTIKPYLANQELNLTMRYWEGAVQVSGVSDGQPVSGDGYVELTGF